VLPTGSIAHVSKGWETAALRDVGPVNDSSGSDAAERRAKVSVRFAG
jgi:hypothetical protein